MEEGHGGLRAADLTWYLYEPIPSRREDLRLMPHLDRLHAYVLGARSEIDGVSAGMALLTNVLHALDPKQWAEAIGDCHTAIRDAHDGLILILEMHPLLALEKSAIPIPSETLELLFSELGFSVNVRSFNVNSAPTYCVAVSRAPADLPESDQLVSLVETHWSTRQERLLRLYEGTPRVRSAADRANLLNATFGIARIASWFNLARGDTRLDK